MRLLLDTNVVLMLSDDPALLRPEVVELLEADETVMLLSAVVPWEVAIKWRIGKLELAHHPRDWTRAVRDGFGVRPVPITYEHVVGVADLPPHHSDPFDRLLIAQARVEGVPIVTADRNIPRYDVETLAAV
ncbi:type II toxin-antitoxin system VapC family toxin [Pseudonocardia sp.]|uniref:type II toxin-antitoxin system VapC family toxin n=1 Tax=Pseudonocardia sp. TaxID=60912 RepID=UPI003D0A4936